MGNLVPSTTPLQSTREFVAPSAMPIKKTPEIIDIIGEGGKQKTESKKEEESEKNKEEETVEKEEEIIETVEPSPSKFEGVPEGRGSFPTQWHTMFDQVFASVPTIYIPLKETLPKVENNIITVSVKNEVQKEHFEAKTREVLEFLRTHFSEQIEDIVVEANEQLETKKIIYDVKDKLQNFKEQNTEFEDFLQILELKIKD